MNEYINLSKVLQCTLIRQGLTYCTDKVLIYWTLGTLPRYSRKKWKTGFPEQTKATFSSKMQTGNEFIC